MRRRQAGLTLLEVLVALALFAVVAAMAYGGLDGVLRAKETMDRLAEPQLAYLFIQRDVEQAMPRSIRDAYGERRDALLGGTLLELTHTGWRNPLDRPRPAPPCSG